MDLIIMALIFVGGLFYFKNKVKYPMWESFKTAIWVLVIEFAILRLSVFQGDDEKIMAGLLVTYTLVILIVGLKMYRFKDRKYVPKEKQLTE